MGLNLGRLIRILRSVPLDHVVTFAEAAGSNFSQARIRNSQPLADTLY